MPTLINSSVYFLYRPSRILTDARNSLFYDRRIFATSHIELQCHDSHTLFSSRILRNIVCLSTNYSWFRLSFLNVDDIATRFQVLRWIIKFSYCNRGTYKNGIHSAWSKSLVRRSVSKDGLGKIGRSRTV